MLKQPNGKTKSSTLVTDTCYKLQENPFWQVNSSVTICSGEGAV